MQEKQANEEEQENEKDIEQEEEKVEVVTIEKLEEELKKQQDKYLLLLAEMENARKRMQKDKHDSTRYAIENVILDFLSPMDNFENALSFAHQTSEETQNWAKGFEMILAQFREILENHNIKTFQAEGKHFDPHLHEVIEIEETEKCDEGMILQEFMRGYQCGDRILRPSRVKVAKKPAKAKTDEVEDEKVN